LLGKNEQLPMRDFQVLSRWRAGGAIPTTSHSRAGADQVDFDRDVTLLLDLANRH
jgi:hypothetical protein